MAKRAVVRKVVKWGGLPVCVLLAVALVGSCWYKVGWVTPNYNFVYVAAGQLCLAEPELRLVVDGGSAFWFRAPNTEMQCWFGWGQRNGPRYVAVPLWIPLLIVAGATAFAWRADARARRFARVGACPACGYDRRGLEVGKVCPECGAASRGESMAKPDA